MLVGAVLPLFSFVTAQNFQVPTSWRKPESGLTQQERLNLVDGFLATVMPDLNSDSGQFNPLFVPQSASMLSAFAIGDRINGSTTNKNAVLNSLNKVFTTNPTIITLPGSGLNSDVAVWGLAAINAYRAYKDTNALQFARSAWKQLSAAMVTPEDSTAQKHPLKTPNIASTCANGHSTAGAVFYVANNASDTNVNAETTAGFMTLSALLYEATSEPDFLSAAETSAGFVTGALNSGNFIIDTITLQNCTPSVTSLSYNSGYAIAGLSVLGSTNDTYAAMRSQLVSTVIPNPEWTDPQTGVINEGAGDITANHFTLSVKTIYIRGLYEAYSRIPADSPEAALIRSYIFVQHNALQELASQPGSNQYSPHFIGPPPANLLSWGQLAAADTLYAALGLTDVPTSTMTSLLGPTATAGNSPPNTSQNPGSPARKASGISPAVIAGLVVGVILLLLLILAIFFVRKRRQRTTGTSALEAANTQSAPRTTEPQSDDVPVNEKYTYRFSSDGVQDVPATPRMSTSSPGGSLFSSAPPDYVTTDSQPEDPFDDIYSDSTSSAGGTVSRRRVDLAGIQGVVQHINRLMTTEQGPQNLPAAPPPSYEE
ncbi:hypothetical protein BC629DRAFT_1522930 [Irpex lacteus]|nr:hypothetical protein BC629DRAFT_1522930 [Irpex lacteus]